jgi:hypothetical protein
MKTLEEKIAMIEGYIFARGWEQVPMFVDQMGCIDSYEEYSYQLLNDILDATRGKETFLSVYEDIKKTENKKDFGNGNEGSFNEDYKDRTFKDIDSILSDNVKIYFFHTSNAGMVDLGNYEALNGRGEKYNEKLRDQKEKRKQ